MLIASQEPGTDEQLKEAAKLVQAAGAKTARFAGAERGDPRRRAFAPPTSRPSELGGLDILVNALDAPAYGPAEAGDDAAFDESWRTISRRVWMACQEGARVMLRRAAASIVEHHVGAGGARRAERGALLRGEGRGAESDARAGARMGAQGIRVNARSRPDDSKTDEPGAGKDDEFAKNLLKYLPYNRLVKPEELAGALLYLVSPAAGFVTGESIAVDGGLLCRV